MTYTINTLRDGNQFGGENGVTGDKHTVISNLLESRKLCNLSEEALDEIEQGLLTNGRASYDVYSYTLIALPYSECRIKPSHGGFGAWDAEFSGEEWGEESELLAAMKDGIDGELLELGVDELPEGVKDIRGNIHNEPARVFAIIDSDGNFDGYTGIRIEA